MVETILLIVLIVLVVALFVISYFKKKKFNTELGQMRDELKVGDKVMTDTGVVGEVADSYVEDEYKYFVLKTGKDDKIGYFTVHANAIYYVFGKENKQDKVVVKVSDEPQTDNKNSDEPASVKETKVETTTKTKSKSKK